MKTFKNEHPTCKCIPKQAVLTPDRYRALLAGSPIPPPTPFCAIQNMYQYILFDGENYK